MAVEILFVLTLLVCFLKLSLTLTITHRCGTPQSLLLTHDNIERMALLYVPSEFCACTEFNVSSSHSQHRERVPVLIALHCLGCDINWELNKWRTLSEQYGFVLVAPRGGARQDKPSWNADVCCGPALEQNYDDVAFIHALLSQLFTSFSASFPCITLSFDALFFTGFSNGGFMTDKLGWSYVGHSQSQHDVEHPKIVAISPMAGYLYEPQKYAPTNGGNSDDGNDRPALAVWLHHSVTDETVRKDGCCSASNACAVEIDRHSTACVSVEQAWLHWLLWNGCDTQTYNLSFAHVEVRTGARRCAFATKEGHGCQAETRLCLYDDTVHSAWAKQFPLAKEVVLWFLRLLCEQHGEWIHEHCACRSDHTGRYCQTLLRVDGEVNQTQTKARSMVASTAKMKNNAKIDKVRLRGHSRIFVVFGLCILAVILSAIYYQAKYVRNKLHRNGDRVKYQPLAQDAFEDEYAHEPEHEVDENENEATECVIETDHDNDADHDHDDNMHVVSNALFKDTFGEMSASQLRALQTLSIYISTNNGALPDDTKALIKFSKSRDDVEEISGADAKYVIRKYKKNLKKWRSGKFQAVQEGKSASPPPPKASKSSKISKSSKKTKKRPKQPGLTSNAAKPKLAREPFQAKLAKQKSDTDNAKYTELAIAKPPSPSASMMVEAGNSWKQRDDTLLQSEVDFDFKGFDEPDPPKADESETDEYYDEDDNHDLGSPITDDVLFSPTDAIDEHFQACILRLENIYSESQHNEGGDENDRAARYHRFGNSDEIEDGSPEACGSMLNNMSTTLLAIPSNTTVETEPIPEQALSDTTTNGDAEHINATEIDDKELKLSDKKAEAEEAASVAVVNEDAHVGSEKLHEHDITTEIKVSDDQAAKDDLSVIEDEEVKNEAEEQVNEATVLETTANGVMNDDEEVALLPKDVTQPTDGVHERRSSKKFRAYMREETAVVSCGFCWVSCFDTIGFGKRTDVPSESDSE